MRAQENIVNKELLYQAIKSNNIDKYVDMRLEIWADWYMRDHHGLGYPNKTIEWRLIHEGGVLIKGTGEKYTQSNAYAEEVEFHIVAMREYKPLSALAITERYLKDMLIETIARRNNISVRRIQERIKEGKLWLASRLTAKNDAKYY